MQKRLIVFRVFDQSHTTYIIFRFLKIILEESEIENKIFVIYFATTITTLTNLYNPNFSGKYCH